MCKWDKDTWKEATYREIYKRVKAITERKRDITDQDGNTISWVKIMGFKMWQEKTLTNKERIINYRIAHGGYFFGRKKVLMGLIPHNPPEARCGACRSGEYTIEHTFYSCPLAKAVWSGMMQNYMA